MTLSRPNTAQTPPEASQLADILHAFLIDVPYNSLSQFYQIFDNQSPPAHFGTSCVWQSYLLGDRILASMDNCKLSYLNDNRHIALLCETGSRQYLLDPYLLHTTPIELPVKRTERASSAAYPHRLDSDGNSRWGKLLAQRDDSILRLLYTRYSPIRKHSIIARAFHLDMSRHTPGKPPSSDFVRPLLHHGEQNNLSIRVVLRDSHEMAELIYPISLQHRQPVKHANLLARNNQGEFTPSGDAAYREILKRMALSLGCSTNDLENFVLGGVTIYEQHAPDHINYSPYRIINE